MAAAFEAFAAAFEAFIVRNDEQGFRTGLEQVTPDFLPEGNVLVRVTYSSVNYKDGLAGTADGKIVRSYPFIPGIDLAGEVVESRDARYAPGDQVLCTGYELGVSHFGGYSQYARVQGDWLVRLPEGLSAKVAMAVGTAGFTAALSVHSLLDQGLAPESGPILVTGATGGVGSTAVAILSRLGFEVTASTGKAETQTALLKSLGAAHVISREEAQAVSKGALAKTQWAGIVDPVGGPATAEHLKRLQYGGILALSGLTGGGSFDATVFPFILRGVRLQGIDSVYCPMPLRSEIWNKLAEAWKPVKLLELGIQEVTLSELPDVLAAILQGQAAGRTVVRIND
ncbi:acryloyl-CoA reductase [Paenibacillus sp. JX-17]|uniref:Acryloyl-CoA reductase n=1 Tax=Paenibacillus lacisoli TaxID=3064525 RepID=A0ABT9C908_9BACL|nr:acryloyl-CoA reductase [Paenibacillus sp. JX-17]MDO7905745.1 acryloyl-CoA reductase [Paenibacillus sp. JX-17]